MHIRYLKIQYDGGRRSVPIVPQSATMTPTPRGAHQPARLLSLLRTPKAATMATLQGAGVYIVMVVRKGGTIQISTINSEILRVLIWGGPRKGST